MTKNIHCLIPAAGKGTRMRPLTHTLPKAMMAVAGKPAIFHIIDKVHQAGIENFTIITGYLKEFMESEILQAYPNLNIRFIEQKEQKGLGHAIYMAKDNFSDDDGLIIVYGDTLFEADIPAMLKSEYAVIGVKEVEDPRRFGVVELGNDNIITNFIEKAENPPTNLAIPGVNYFPQSAPLFKALQHIIDNNIKTKGEFQVTDAYALMVKEYDLKMTIQILDAWYDAGTLASLLETNNDILEYSGSQLSFIPENSEIIDPVYIASDVELKNCKIGPNVSLGSGCVVDGCEIENSIVDIATKLKNCNIQNSIIGREVNISDVTGTIIVGDHCEINKV